MYYSITFLTLYLTTYLKYMNNDMLVNILHSTVSLLRKWTFLKLCFIANNGLPHKAWIFLTREIRLNKHARIFLAKVFILIKPAEISLWEWNVLSPCLPQDFINTWHSRYKQSWVTLPRYSLSVCYTMWTCMPRLLCVWQKMLIVVFLLGATITVPLIILG